MQIKINWSSSDLLFMGHVAMEGRFTTVIGYGCVFGGVFVKNDFDLTLFCIINLVKIEFELSSKMIYANLR